MKKITIIIDDGESMKEDNVSRPNPSPYTRNYPWGTEEVNRPNDRHNEYPNGWVDGKDLCAGCPNDPRNGGSGVCWCTIPHKFGPNRVFC